MHGLRIEGVVDGVLDVLDLGSDLPGLRLQLK